MLDFSVHDCVAPAKRPNGGASDDCSPPARRVARRVAAVLDSQTMADAVRKSGRACDCMATVECFEREPRVPQVAGRSSSGLARLMDSAIALR